MHAPWYVYLIAVLVALPCYILWAVGGYTLLRWFFSWLMGPEPPPPPSRPKAAARG